MQSTISTAGNPGQPLSLIQPTEVINIPEPVPTMVGPPTRSLLSDLDKLMHRNPITATADWLKRQSNASALNPSNNSSLATTPTMAAAAAASATTTSASTWAHSSQSAASTSKDFGSTQQARTPPTPGDFLVPTNKVEHTLMVARLVSGGSPQAEAEQIITQRKAAYNKALRDFKKDLNAGQQSNPTRRTGRQGKHVKDQSTNNGGHNV